MVHSLQLHINRAASTTLVEQIRNGIAGAIRSGVLAPGARLPSWLDLAEQLGVARGTVKAAYERLADEQLVVATRAHGTRVAGQSSRTEGPRLQLEAVSQEIMYPYALDGAAPFRMGVPGQDCLPKALLARLRAHAARAEVLAAPLYPPANGQLELRQQIAAHLALARGIECQPEQVFITAGFSGALGLLLRVLRLEGRRAWVEDPGFPPSRKALKLAQMVPVPVPVNEQGIDVSWAIRQAPDAALALLTPGQQAPTGVTLSLGRRAQLLDWAARSGAWIIEDDYLGELQLHRRAAPALAARDEAGRVIHVGSFSKTISPALRLGFIVAPAALVGPLQEAVHCLAPAPGTAVQQAIARFMHEGHYLRHLRRTKRAYSSRAEDLQQRLTALGFSVRLAGLAVWLQLPEGAPDQHIATQAYELGLAPSPLSRWSATVASAHAGLLLGVANANGSRLDKACEQLAALIRQG